MMPTQWMNFCQISSHDTADSDKTLIHQADSQKDQEEKRSLSNCYTLETLPLLLLTAYFTKIEF